MVGVFSVQFNRARADKQSEILKQAVIDQTLQIEADPNDAMVYYRRAMLYRELGEYQKTIADLTRVIELEPENREARKYRALTYAFLGNNEQCSEDYAKLIKLDQNIPLPESQYYSILADSIKSRESAKRVVKSLEELNLGQEIEFSKVTVRSETWYRVKIGYFRTKEEAIELISRIKRLPNIEPIIIAEVKEIKQF
jgi:tetratricopeptide (TPR) repeat protein